MTGEAAEVSLEALKDLDLQGLRVVWAARFGAPPKLRFSKLLALMLAWRIQASAHGGLDAEMRKALRRPTSAKPRPAPGAGTRLTREWEGRFHEVIVTGPREYLYRGQSYRSLSQVARHITGVCWNGPRFFGLRTGEGTP